MPLRNLQIEVRQVQSGESQRNEAGSAGGVQIDSQGQVAVQGTLRLQQRQSQQSSSASQLVLVLNGRSARIALGTVWPLRVFQTWLRDGRLVTTQGTLLIQAGTGFSATPRWDGSDVVELEIAAQQAPGNAANAVGALQNNSSTTSVVVVPLGEWSTVAQSEQSSQDQQSGLAGGARVSTQSRTDVQVRVTAR
ncbi:hypothetical protein RS694_19285 [Rhodoferax saidenbachensis]|uniref:Uncharacterized protein n=1 Tax=Rhodoferax saidenbachensis TaxID=1484693 RepID=A0A1P8KEK8_9BURK|nr:hypothetical protein RS694_19285 [Rhodoferax saidenbachensis]